MQIPPAGLIEAAKDEVPTVASSVRADQRKELGVATGAAPGSDFAAGYELGLQTARVMIRQNTSLVYHGVDTDEIL